MFTQLLWIIDASSIHPYYLLICPGNYKIYDKTFFGSRADKCVSFIYEFINSGFVNQLISTPHDKHFVPKD